MGLPRVSWALLFSVIMAQTSHPHLDFFFLLGLRLWHMEVPRLGDESELQLPAYTTATATGDPSHIYNLHHDSQQCRILNPLSNARDGTCILVDASQFHYH